MASTRAVTISDVARAAGVSPMTVSNVINEHRYVRTETRERVLRAMAELDYRVNVAARNLRSGRTGTIGLAVPEVDRPYFGQLAARLIALAAEHDLHVLIEQTGASRENELDALSMSRNRMYDGLILSTVGLGSADIELLRVDYPVVILGERIFDSPVDHVAMANVEGAKAATAHLIERGCRRIVMLDGVVSAEPDVSSLRANGYREALGAAGIPYDPALTVVLPVFSLAAARAAAHELVESGLEFDGVFCVTDTVALGMLRGLADSGIDVPGQVKVIGFDNVEEGEYSNPSLSTIDPDHDLMAKTAMDLLLRRIAGGRGEIAGSGERGPEEFVSSFRVVARESTAARGTARGSDR